ncbi:MAG: hypothetical protein M0Z57_05210 [Deltaproteobacteria bacterium]|jgi:hypothetical protein|nr:hypothetical protein [Deltaproteobacteria bacterium]
MPNDDKCFDRKDKILLVEGQEDIYTIAELMDRHIKWPSPPATPPVCIRDAKSIDTLLKKDYLSGHIKAHEAQIIGILVDADISALSRWNSLKNSLVNFLKEFPENPIPDGFIANSINNKRIGIWIMPDNKSPGMLETCLSTLITGDEKIWEMAEAYAMNAFLKDAPFKDVHYAKACIHTWLAWQDPPGERFGTALKKKIFNSNSELTNKFVEWFKSLYEIS